MITAKDAIRTARKYIGTPYTTLDCINLIKKVIRTAPGGIKNYTTAGTNDLWDSAGYSAKYRDLTWRQEGLTGAKAGHLSFKRYGEDKEDHVGLVTGEGTVIHASSEYGMVVETPLTKEEGWDLLAKHRYIETEDNADREGVIMSGYKAIVALSDEDSTLNLRKKPSTSSTIIGELRDGEEVDVLEEPNSKWLRVRTNGGDIGYISKQYTFVYETENEKIPTEEIPENTITIIDSEGNRFVPAGDFRVLIGSID